MKMNNSTEWWIVGRVSESDTMTWHCSVRHAELLY